MTVTYLNNEATTSLEAHLDGKRALLSIETNKNMYGNLSTVCRVYEFEGGYKIYSAGRAFYQKLVATPCPRVSKKLILSQHNSFIGSVDNISDLVEDAVSHYAVKGSVFSCDINASDESLTASGAN